MQTIEIKNSFYNYKMIVADNGALIHKYFLPVECEKSFNLNSLEERYNPFLHEQLIDINNEGICYPHGTRNMATFCSQRSIVREWDVLKINNGTDTVIVLEDPSTHIKSTLHYECYENSPAIRRYAVHENCGNEPIDISLLTSFTLSNFPYFDDDEKSMFLHYFRSSWCNEGNHYIKGFQELELYSHFNSRAFTAETTGTWPCHEYIPLFVVEQKNAEICTAVQIESSATWRFELGLTSYGMDNSFYMHGGVGNELGTGWKKELQPEEKLYTPSVSLAVAMGDVENALNYMHLHQSRVLTNRSTSDKNLPVMYNDWLYLEGKQNEATIEKQLDILEKAGVEVFITDAGWFCDPNLSIDKGNIWHMTGYYEYNQDRFPNGMKYIADKIKEHNMRAGIWCEIECLGDKSPLYNDPEMLLCINGKPVTDASHRFLNFTSPKVIKYANDIFDRFVEWGFEYVKIDYNSDSAPGSDNCGDKNIVQGQYNNRKAYDNWIESLRKKHPQLIIESCSSGGMRLEYNSLSRADMASITDQNNFKLLGGMLYNVTKAIHPSQCGTWAYTSQTTNDREFVYSLVNAMLGRIHLSGDFEDANDYQKKALIDSVALYKKYRHILNDCFVYHHSGLYYTYKNDERIICFEIRSIDNTESVVMLQRTGCENDTFDLKLSGLCEGNYVMETFPKSETVMISSDELSIGEKIKMENQYSAKILYIHKG